MSSKIQITVSNLPSPFKDVFTYNCRKLDKFTNIGFAKIFQDLTGYEIEYQEVSNKSFAQDIIIFKSEYDCTLCMLKVSNYEDSI